MSLWRAHPFDTFHHLRVAPNFTSIASIFLDKGGDRAAHLHLEPPAATFLVTFTPTRPSMSL